MHAHTLHTTSHAQRLVSMQCDGAYTVRVHANRKSGDAPYSTFKLFCFASISSICLPLSNQVVGSSSASAECAWFLKRAGYCRGYTHLINSKP